MKPKSYVLMRRLKNTAAGFSVGSVEIKDRTEHHRIPQNVSSCWHLRPLLPAAHALACSTVPLAARAAMRLAIAMCGGQSGHMARTARRLEYRVTVKAVFYAVSPALKGVKATTQAASGLDFPV